MITISGTMKDMGDLMKTDKYNVETTKFEKIVKYKEYEEIHLPTGIQTRQDKIFLIVGFIIFSIPFSIFLWSKYFINICKTKRIVSYKAKVKIIKTKGGKTK